ncbi:transglutaminase family protein [Microbacterium sp. NPDC089188]|uniref:transglutaminase-like domain-containing protein n=1 Tax=Microbacterium sp. NPDC089188 TaxID=3154971 RepID=UPI0034444FB5
MRTSVGVGIVLHTEAEADVVLSITPADGWAHDETLTIDTDGRAIPAVEVADAHGTRAHRVVLPAGRTHVTYRGSVSPPRAPAPSDEIDPVRYLRPSRYAPSDDPRLSDLAPSRSSSARERVREITQWVSERLDYVSGVSGPTDTALDTLREGAGVCRDYAHVTIALLRAAGIPARLVSVFAPGLDPMDFHAVVEAFVDGRWEVVDATRLAPRAHFVRIATGRDAADTAFLTTVSGTATLESVEVTAVAVGDLVPDDPDASILLR